MPPLNDHIATKIIKCLNVGDPGAGKTGGLAGLLKLDLKLRIWDYDNLLGSLLSYVKKDYPDKIGNVSYATLTDAPVQGVIPTAYSRGKKLLNEWIIGDENLGKPTDWGDDVVIVIDTLSSLSQAAFAYSKAMNPQAKEQRSWYFTAQDLVRDTLSILKSDAIKCNVIVNAHLNYDKNHIGVTRGYPRSIGSAMNSEIGGGFNMILLTETSADGKARVIRTQSNGIVELKNPVAFKLPDTLPLGTGLATIFEAVRSQ